MIGRVLDLEFLACKLVRSCLEMDGRVARVRNCQNKGYECNYFSFMGLF